MYFLKILISKYKFSVYQNFTSLFYLQHDKNNFRIINNIKKIKYVFIYIVQTLDFFEHYIRKSIVITHCKICIPEKHIYNMK